MTTSERSWVIYILSDPRLPDVVRYVGATHRNPKKRLAAHIYSSRPGGTRTHTSNWIRSLLGVGVKPSLKVVDSGAGPGWEASEMYWIARYKGQGCDLTNHTAGGEGSLGFQHSPETRAKLRADKLGRKLSPEHRAKISVAGRGRTPSPETRAKLSAGKRGNNPSAEARAKISAAHLGTRHSPEARAKMSAAQQGRKRSPETCAKLSESIRKSWESRGRGVSPEARAKMSVAQRARRENSRRGNPEDSDGR